MQDPNDPSQTPPPYNEPPAAGQASDAGIPADQRQWALFTHLSALIGFIIPFGNILGPLVMWLVKRETMPFADEQGKEALNFNITVGIIGLALVVLTFITFGLGVILTAPIGVAVFVAWLVLTIIAAIKANDGLAYRYPFTMRLVK
ncbi:DUF4870 domain-containing protein [Lysobacter alkalisoli]|uniref:DUF4870 domain-containing protein n=2 Tax=Marilutibacter alkalisoli TaxID=2591633 RepID=A0A514BWS5_9GAMM|nr:DUF4870 domain-containing protein [Lysobacter alkalisoli]